MPGWFNGRDNLYVSHHFAQLAKVKRLSLIGMKLGGKHFLFICWAKNGNDKLNSLLDVVKYIFRSYQKIGAH